MSCFDQPTTPLRINIPQVWNYRLAGERDLIAASLFYEDSTRTNTSFTVAGMPVGLTAPIVEASYCVH